MEERERQIERQAKRERETKREGRRYDSGRVMKQSEKDREHGGRPWNVIGTQWKVSCRLEMTHLTP